jgi:hypothetical protein
MTDKHDAHDPHDAPEKHGAHDKDHAAHPKAEPEAPPVQEYPKMVYGPGGEQKTVATKEEEAAAKTDGFSETPGEKADHARPKKEPR